MVTSGGPGPGPTSWSVARILSAAVLALVLALTPLPGATPAVAQPAPPDTAEGAAAQLEQVQADAELLTEQWHAAKDAPAVRRGEVEAMRAAAGPARLAVEEARAAEERFRAQVDVLTLAAHESGNLDQFNALLASGSPQDFLDQMSVPEMLASGQRIVLDELLVVVDDTAAAHAEADRDGVRAGDLVFFNSPVSHIGIAVDNDTMVNSPQTGDVVKYSSLTGRDLAGVRRL